MVDMRGLLRQLLCAKTIDEDWCRRMHFVCVSTLSAGLACGRVGLGLVWGARAQWLARLVCWYFWYVGSLGC